MPDNNRILDAHIGRVASIKAKLDRLQQLAGDHFHHTPDAINWGHVGDLARVDNALDELLAIFNTK